MAILNFNYNQAISQAKQIEAVAEEMQNTANRQFQTTIDAIKGTWRGDASRQFTDYCAVTQSEMRVQAKKLKDLARRIREVARIIEEAEQKAKEIQRQQEAAAASKKSDGDGKGGGFSGGSTHGGGGGGGSRF